VLACGATSYRSLRSILEKGMDRVPPQEEATFTMPLHHANLRGPDYFGGEEENLPC